MKKLEIEEIQVKLFLQKPLM